MSFKQKFLAAYPLAKCVHWNGRYCIFKDTIEMPFEKAYSPRVAWRKAWHKHLTILMEKAPSQ